MAVFSTSIIDDPISVAQRLEDFGLSVAQIVAIRDAARSAADDASPLMPINAPGTLAYIHGVEALRAHLLDGVWEMDRALGIEAVINRERNVRLAYQNVDKACDLVFTPMPRSAKGPASEKLCNHPLFEYYGMVLDTDHDRLPEGDLGDPLEGDMVTYFVMVGEDGSVELSSPIIEGRRYGRFRERIFIDDPDADWESRIELDSDPVTEFDVPVSLKDAH